MPDIRKENSDRMKDVSSSYDFVIVCTNNEKQCAYWQSRLDDARGSVLAESATVIAVYEDWPGGAGNGLGTLYAYEKAAAVAKANGKDISALLAAGTHSAALFHTAGKGTRLAPLPGAENNNKPGVKLPACVALKSGGARPITILEAVIKQTGAYAASRKGRLSVYWGDQVFIPSVPIAYTPRAHIDILCTLGPMPTQEEWAAKGMQGYGLIAVNSSGKAVQVEKVTHEQALKMTASLGNVEQVGVSLGSFSLSHPMLAALLAEFAPELQAKVGKLDTDPHFWMPMTLSEESYIELMASKKVAAAESKATHARMADFLARFAPAMGSFQVFSAVDVGSSAYWWDYGQLRWYQLYNGPAYLCGADAALAEQSAMMRDFFGVKHGACATSKVDPGVALDGSVVSASVIAAGSLKNSAVCDSRIGSLTCTDSIVIGVTAATVQLGKGCVVYGVTDEAGIVLEDGDVLVEVTNADGSRFRIKSNLSIDGGQAWKEVVCGNPYSFEQVNVNNDDADIVAIEALRAAHTASLAKALHLD